MAFGIALMLLSLLRMVYDIRQRRDGVVPKRGAWMRTWVMYWIGVVAFLGSGLPTNAAPAVHIPTSSVRYRVQLERAAGSQWGINAPVARIAAQLHQESGWNPQARSVFAQGLSQFTPRTAAWIPEICPSLGEPDPWDPAWSIHAAVCYDGWLLDRAPGTTTCDRWAMTLSAYNGGEVARDRERTAAYEARDSPDRWFGQVERYRSRSAAAWRENRNYVRRILLVLEPAYITAGWPGTVAC
ncbi:MAG: transglycosylase SLT domain-containing protein [Xanthomonadales bacterium]|nr:transglycosylase SLT domain-containing protein [Xanthomonadales bacterium]